VSDLFKRARALFGLADPESEPEPRARPVPTVRKQISAWHAVSIVPGPRACEAAREMRGRRYLSREAPTLPLKKCDAHSCICRYEHFTDRRKGARRTVEMSVTIEGKVPTDRRAKYKRGRRKTDL